MVNIIVFTIVFLDQLAKFLALRLISQGQSIEIIRHVLYFSIVKNTGAAFGIFKNGTIFFLIISITAVICVLLILKKVKGADTLLKCALAMILGGALGNLIDRLRFACVIDFIDFRVWPVFNIADACISIGAALLILRIMRSK